MIQGKFTGAIGAIIENTNTGKVLLLKRSPKKDFIPNTWEEGLQDYLLGEDGYLRNINHIGFSG